MDKQLTVLKLGGSVITDKHHPFRCRYKHIQRLAREIAASRAKPLLIVHGGGSFGHPLAGKFDLNSGFKRPTQLRGFAITRQAMMTLNKVILDALIERNVDAISIQPSAFIQTSDGRVITMATEILTRLLDKGFVPLLHGDVVMDIKMGFAVLSGDQIVSKLALQLKAGRILIGTDVDGLFNKDPKTYSKVQLYMKLSSTKLKTMLPEIKPSLDDDVTGGMLGKMYEMIEPAENGVHIHIINALKNDIVLDALRGKKVKGTSIR